MFIGRGERVDCIATESIPLGTSRNVRPLITEIEIEPELTIVMYTDGLVHAGERTGRPMNVCEVVRFMLEDEDPAPQQLADGLLAHAVNLDENRPADDLSVVVIRVSPRQGDAVRRMSVRLPI
jgi:serine phosphatase RsbU (regulator of sigma subunit)